ncbi:MAG: portal protein, partial [Candidatus Thorarchaeota archaeon]
MAKAHDILARYEEAKSEFTDLYQEMAEDYDFYNSNQWRDDDIARQNKNKAPVLNLNYVKKSVDVLAGFQRQNATDIKVFPIEGGDERVAEVYSRLIKWIMADRNANHEISRAFKDMAICGIGWIAPEINFDMDVLSGDIKVKKVDPFNILVDPHFKEQDLSDAEYIIRHKKVSKSKLKQLYPGKSKVIDGISDKQADNEGVRQEVQVPSDLGEEVMTIEHWGKEYVSRTFLVDVEDPASTQEFEGGEEELEAALAQNPNLRAIKRTVPKVKLTIIAGTHTTATLFEGDNPFSTKTFPFIPIMGYFDTGTDRWMYRLSGLIRHMKDPQREKNKRRSLIMETIQKMPQYGYVMDRGAVDDINSLKRKDNLIEKNPGREFREIAPTQIPAAVVTLEQLFDQDIQRIGANPDLLGMQVGREESGVVQSARVRQGLMSNQELFDNTGFAKRILGRQL